MVQLSGIFTKYITQFFNTMVLLSVKCREASLGSLSKAATNRNDPISVMLSKEPRNQGNKEPRNQGKNGYIFTKDNTLIFEDYAVISQNAARFP